MLTSLPVLAAILGGLALVISLFCLWQIYGLRRLRKIFFAGKNALDLEAVITTLQIKLESSEQHQQILDQSLAQLQNQLSFAIQKVGMVRFNPFSDGGGNFSFCVALLDAHDNGVVITSMYGREQNRIYTKKLVAGKSETPLNEEEQKAFLIANQKN